LVSLAYFGCVILPFQGFKGHVPLLTHTGLITLSRKKPCSNVNACVVCKQYLDIRWHSGVDLITQWLSFTQIHHVMQIIPPIRIVASLHIHYWHISPCQEYIHNDFKGKYLWYYPPQHVILVLSIAEHRWQDKNVNNIS
jgi:hypothetical protein